MVPKVKMLIGCLSFGVLSACSPYAEDMARLDQKLAQPLPDSNAMAMTQVQNLPAIETAAGENMGILGASVSGAPVMPGPTLEDYLAREYIALAKIEHEKSYDYKAAQRYLDKAKKAANGQAVWPSMPKSYDLRDQDRVELSAARVQLIEALQSPVYRANPQALAKAQISYDCWMERAEEAAKPEHYAECKAQYEQSMSMLIAQYTLPAAGEEAQGPSGYSIP